MYRFESLGCIACLELIKGDFIERVSRGHIFEQIGDISHGLDLFYGNTAETMGLYYFECELN